MNLFHEESTPASAIRTRGRGAIVRVFLSRFCILFLAGCGSTSITSRWAESPVLADGINTEWRQGLTNIAGTAVMLGVRNDGEYLYLALSTANRDMQRLLMQRGLTLWFDKDGGDARTFGIRYPPGRERRSGVPGEERVPEEQTPADRRMTRERAANELEICGPGKDERHRVALLEAGGIAVGLETGDGVLVFEARIPLTESGPHPFAIGAAAGARIGLGLVAGAERSSRRMDEGFSDEQSGQGGMGTGMGGGFGNGDGEGRMRGRRGGADSPAASIDQWFVVQLADGLHRKD